MKKLKTLKEHINLTEDKVKVDSKRFEGDLIGAMRHISDGGVEKFTDKPGGHNVGPSGSDAKANIQWSPDKKVMDPKDKDNYDKKVHDTYRLLTGMISRFKKAKIDISNARTGPKQTDTGLSEIYKEFGASSGEGKTDIIFGPHYVSVKNAKGAQLMSGQGNETAAIIQSCVLNNDSGVGNLAKGMAKDAAKIIQKAMNKDKGGMFIKLTGKQTRPVLIRLGKQTIEKLKKTHKKAWTAYKKEKKKDYNLAVENLLKAWGWFDRFNELSPAQQKKALKKEKVEFDGLWRILEPVSGPRLNLLSPEAQKEYAEQVETWKKNQEYLNRILGFDDSKPDKETLEAMMIMASQLGIDEKITNNMSEFFKDPKVYRAIIHEAATGANKFSNKEAVATDFLAWGDDADKPKYAWHTADEFVDAVVKSGVIKFGVSLREAGKTDKLNALIHADTDDDDLEKVMIDVSRGGGFRGRMGNIFTMFAKVKKMKTESWIPLDNSDYQFIQESWNEFETDTTRFLLEDWKETEEILLQEGILSSVGNAYTKVKAGIKKMLGKVKGFFMAMTKFFMQWVKNVGMFIQAWDMKIDGGLPANMASNQIWPSSLGLK